MDTHKVGNLFIHKYCNNSDDNQSIHSDYKTRTYLCIKCFFENNVAVIDKVRKITNCGYWIKNTGHHIILINLYVTQINQYSELPHLWPLCIHMFKRWLAINEEVYISPNWQKIYKSAGKVQSPAKASPNYFLPKFPNCLCVISTGQLELFLWRVRPGSPTYQQYCTASFIQLNKVNK